MDFGNITVKEMLEKKLGKEEAEVVLKVVNQGYEEGARGEELTEHVKKALGKVDSKLAMDPATIILRIFAVPVT